MIKLDIAPLIAPGTQYPIAGSVEAAHALRATGSFDQIDAFDDPVQVVSRRPKKGDLDAMSIRIVTPMVFDALFRPAMDRSGSQEAFLSRFSFDADLKACVRRGAAYTWLRTPHGRPERVAAERRSLDLWQQVYPAEVHSWMVGYTAWMEDRIAIIEEHHDRK